MKMTLLKTCSALAIAAALATPYALAEEKAAAKKGDPKMMEEMMKKAMAAGAPGAAHKAIEPLVGEWNVEVKTWMAPDAPPTVTKGSAKASWILDKRFIQEEFKGEFMGQPFNGLSLLGYDNMKKKYSSLWLDSMHTAMFVTEGEASEGGKVIKLEGSFHCPMTDSVRSMKQVTRIESADKHIFEMYDPDQGDRKTMEITYTRK